MPTVITQNLRSSKEYAPLADEVNPPFGNVAPSPTVSNGAVVYSKSLPSSGSNTPTDETFTLASSRILGNQTPISPFGDDAHERVPLDSEEADISVQNRRDKGKGKARAWEDDGYTASPSDSPQGGSYPPANEEEDEERRIQANLAKFTARETARRKAARTSQVVSPTPSSASSSTTSLPRSSAPRPLTIITEGISSKRNSLMGYVGGLVGKDKNDGAPQEMELASPISAHAQTASNPYDPKPPRSKPMSPTSPSMQPTSPFADPPGMSSPVAGAPAESPIGGGVGYGYGGPSSWREGGDVQATENDIAPPPKERWWHSLCAWGADLDGGHGKKTSNQAGRTNPFE